MDAQLPDMWKMQPYPYYHAIALLLEPNAATVEGKDAGNACATSGLHQDHLWGEGITTGPAMQALGKNITPGLTVDVVEETGDRRPPSFNSHSSSTFRHNTTSSHPSQIPREIPNNTTSVRQKFREIHWQESPTNGLTSSQKIESLHR